MEAASNEDHGVTNWEKAGYRDGSKGRAARVGGRGPLWCNKQLVGIIMPLPHFHGNSKVVLIRSKSLVHAPDRLIRDAGKQVANGLPGQRMAQVGDQFG